MSPASVNVTQTIMIPSAAPRTAPQDRQHASMLLFYTHVHLFYCLQSVCGIDLNIPCSSYKKSCIELSGIITVVYPSTRCSASPYLPTVLDSESTVVHYNSINNDS